MQKGGAEAEHAVKKVLLRASSESCSEMRHALTFIIRFDLNNSVSVISLLGYLDERTRDPSST